MAFIYWESMRNKFRSLQEDGYDRLQNSKIAYIENDDGLESSVRILAPEEALEGHQFEANISGIHLSQTKDQDNCLVDFTQDPRYQDEASFTIDQNNRAIQKILEYNQKLFKVPVVDLANVEYEPMVPDNIYENVHKNVVSEDILTNLQIESENLENICEKKFHKARNKESVLRDLREIEDSILILEHFQVIKNLPALRRRFEESRNLILSRLS